MNNVLNRIEKEYVLEFFKIQRPKLSLFHNNTFYYINTNEYVIKQDYVVFLNTELIPKKNVKILFNHKERPFYFFSEIKKNKEILLFKLPEKIYKYRNMEHNRDNFLILKADAGFKMKAILENDFPLELSSADFFFTTANKKLPSPYTLVKQKITDDMNLPSIIIKKIYDLTIFTKKIKISTCLIFIDSKFILIFCSQKDANLISTSISPKADLYLNNRKINISLNYLFFYEISNKNIEFFKDEAKQIKTALSGVLCLSLKNIDEEDCRFLHEFTYSTKYGI